jgi:hypothetical protein
MFSLIGFFVVALCFLASLMSLVGLGHATAMTFTFYCDDATKIRTAFFGNVVVSLLLFIAICSLARGSGY